MITTARIEARQARFEDRPHDRAPTASALCKLKKDAFDERKRRQTTSKRIVDRSLDHPRLSESGEIAQRACRRRHRNSIESHRVETAANPSVVDDYTW